MYEGLCAASVWENQWANMKYKATGRTAMLQRAPGAVVDHKANTSQCSHGIKKGKKRKKKA